MLAIQVSIYASVQGQDGSSVSKDTVPLASEDTAAYLSDSSSIQTDSTIGWILERLSKIQQNQQQNSEVISGLLQGNRIDNKTKYELIKSNLINANVTYRLLNDGINKLRSKAAMRNLTLLIDSLSAPDNQELGFSFNNQIMKMVAGVLLKGKSLRSKQSKKIISATNSILQSPIFRRVTSISPSLGIANSIMTFLRSEEVQEYVDGDNLKEFEQQLNRYLIYYNALNGADTKFRQEVSFRDDQLSGLQTKLYYSLEFVGSPLGVELPDTSKGQSVEAALNTYFDQFTQKQVTQYFDSLEKKYTPDMSSNINYEGLLRDNMRLKEVNNNLESLVLNGKKFENIYDSYIDLIGTYCTQVGAALDVAGNYQFASRDILEKEKNTLSDLKTRTIQAIQDTIQIKALQTNMDQINYQQKVF